MVRIREHSEKRLSLVMKIADAYDQHMLADVELKQLRALQAVAQEGSFAKAASRLGFTQSAVSQQVAALERAVGDRLFDRPGGPRPAVLTPVGELLLAHAGDLLGRQDDLAGALRDLRSGSTGHISVGSFQSVSVRVLPEVLGRLRAERPRLDIRCGEFDEPEDAIGRLRSGEYEVAFTVGEVPTDLDSVSLLVDPFVVVAPARDTRREMDVGGLAGLPIIGQYSRCQCTVEEAVAKVGVTFNYVFRSNDNTAVQAMVRADMGYAVMPRLAVDVDDPGVSIISIDDTVAPRLISVARPRDRTMNAAVDRFVEIAVSVVESFTTT